jgi:hypothetical protein
VMTFASPSADCGACWSSMRFMIAERQDESIAAPRTSAHAAERALRTAHSQIAAERAFHAAYSQ